MAYPVLAILFFLSLGGGLALIVLALVRPRYFRKVMPLAAVWIGAYSIFIMGFTGPADLNRPARNSPYKLPWRTGDRRFVAQGNRSFTSHRSDHLYAWDFVMPNGTEVLAVRDGVVTEIVDSFTGIGRHSNFIKLRHADGQYSVYAHIAHALVHLGEPVRRGQAIALSGMVGQTIFPHVHFYVTDPGGRTSIPIAFADAGVPLAGHFYTAGESLQ